MIRTVSVVPAVLTADKQVYQQQLDKINTFSHRIQVDVTDGQFAPANTLDINNVWWPEGWTADLHFMAAQPSASLPVILKLKPSLCILHAEASEDLTPVYQQLKAAGIRTGVALLPQTFPGNAKQYIDQVDEVLIFAGRLGEQGSPADMLQMEKVAMIRGMKPEVEIGWDGGANMNTLRALAHADLDTIYVGSAISAAPDPAQAYQELVAEIDKNGVVI